MHKIAFVVFTAVLLGSGAAFAVGPGPSNPCGSGTSGDPGQGGWTLAQEEAAGAKPTTDFYQPSGTGGDPGQGGWTLAQEEAAGAKPTTDFAHPSGSCAR